MPLEAPVTKAVGRSVMRVRLTTLTCWPASLPVVHDVAVNWLSAQSLIESFSTAGVIAIVFAETGLLIGIFLPGDSLLVTAGIAAGGNLAHIHLNLAALLIGCPIAAIAGS